MSARTRGSRLWSLPVIFCLLLGAGLMGAAPANAALAAVAGLTPTNGEPTSPSPVLEWTRVTDAAKY